MLGALFRSFLEHAGPLTALGTLLAGGAAVVSALYLWYIHRKRIKASIDIIHRYIQIEKEDYSSEGINIHKEVILKYIEKGYRDNSNYSPIVIYSKSAQPSFEQISEICYHLKKDEQRKVLLHFSLISRLSEISSHINSDYFRSLSQVRKKDIYEQFTETMEKMGKSINEVDESLTKREKRIKTKMCVIICAVLLLVYLGLRQIG